MLSHIHCENICIQKAISQIMELVMISTEGKYIRLHMDAFLTSSCPSPRLLSRSNQTTVFIAPRQAREPGMPLPQNKP